MGRTLQELQRFFRELKRRNVYRVAVAYLAVAFVGFQAVKLLIPSTTLPAWADELILAFLIVGFPVSLVVAWAFEMTPRGVRRTTEARPEDMAMVRAGSEQSSFAVRIFVVLSLIAVVGGASWYLIGEIGEGPGIQEQTVAVLPFEVTGSGTEDWREGMVTIVGTGLDGAVGLRAIADRTVLSAWERRGEGREGASTREAVRVARRTGAEFAVVGSAAGLGSELRFAAALYDTDSGERLDQVKVQGSPDSLTALAHELTRRLIGALAQRAEGDLRSADLASVTTRSVAGLKAYLQGERHSRGGEFRAAVEDYRSAVARDSSFALAYWQLANASGWVEAGSGAPYLERAYQLAHRLPRRERRLVRSAHMWRRAGRHVAAVDSLRALTESYPDDPRIWYELGRLIFHGGLPGGWREADEAFAQAVTLDPGHARYQIHYLHLGLAFQHDSALAVERWRDHPRPGTVAGWFQLAVDLAFGGPERRREMLARLDSATARGNLRWSRLAYGLSHPEDGEVQERVLQKAVEDPRAARALFHNFLRRGQLNRALAVLPPAPSGTVTSCGLADAVSHGYPVPDSVARLRILSPARADDTSPEQLLCAGILLVEQGRTHELEGLIARLNRVGTDSADKSHLRRVRARNALEILRGYGAWKTGDREGAARLLSYVLYRPDILVFPWHGIWRGDLLSQLGQFELAEGWYLSTWWHPLAHERLGQLYEEMDKPEKAAKAYRRFVAAWEDADPELQPRVEEARKRLRELTASEAEPDE